ncbi:MAG: phosphoribosylformylglycinamidine cyclo-ligase [Planctomycetota bacterium]
MSSDPLTYRDAGVDIDAQDAALDAAKEAIRSTFTPGVMSDVGLFGGLFDLTRLGLQDAILVASADGVGTKLDVAKRAGVHDTVGRDLVQHCINDILAQGARPLFFMDYVGTGKLEPNVVADLIRGCAEACRDHGAALLGGETAEMPGLYAAGDFDLVGFIVGAVERERVLDGSQVRAGQVLLGLESDGLHTNGYSLARKVCFDRLGLERVAALPHITGGGLPGNVNRVLGDRLDAVIDRSSWTVPGLFELLVRGGDVPRDEAYRAFNMGIGLVVVVEPEEADRVAGELAAAGERVHRIGELVAGTGEVRWAD